MFQPDVFVDQRGEIFEEYNVEKYNELIKEEGLKFVIDTFSISHKNVLRGFHGDTKNWKLIDVIHGYIYFVVIDARQTSTTYKNVEYFFLNDKNKFQVLVPAGCVNAHYVLSDKCIFHYKLSQSYVNQSDQIHIKWNDPTFNICWPPITPILSSRDT